MMAWLSNIVKSLRRKKSPEPVPTVPVSLFPEPEPVIDTPPAGWFTIPEPQPAPPEVRVYINLKDQILMGLELLAQTPDDGSTHIRAARTRLENTIGKIQLFTDNQGREMEHAITLMRYAAKVK